MGIIEFDNAAFTYDGASNALDGVSLRVEPGEFLCVLGGNGSGKSTLAKHVNALLVPDTGTVTVLDRDTRNPGSVFHVRSNVGMVFQNPDDQIVASIIEDDVAFGPENLGIPNPELRERVTEALAQVGLQGFEKRETAALSGGQKQRVAIAGALAMHPQILVFDEASAMLDPRGRKGLLRVCRELNAEGFTIVYITHFMEEAARADRIVVLDKGKVALEGAPADVLTQVERLEQLHLDVPFPAHMSRLLQERGIGISTCITTDDLAKELQQCQHNPAASEAKRGLPEHGRPLPPLRGGQVENAPVIKLDNVSFTYEPAPRKKEASRSAAEPAKWGNDPDERWALQDVSLEVVQGELLGIAGHTGSGKSTLIQLSAGLLKPASGRMEIGGANLADKKAAKQAREQVGTVFQYPERQLFAATVFDDVAFGPRNLGLSADEVAERVRAALEAVRLDADALRDKSPFALSGGQQRRIAIAGVIAMDPQVLIMDEPAAGLDPQAHAMLLDLIDELHRQRGLTIVLVSHSMDDLAQLCDRVAVLNRGHLVTTGTPAEVFADEESLRAIGLGLPHVVRLSQALGIETPGIIPTDDQLADAIAMQTGTGSVCTHSPGDADDVRAI